MAIDKAKRARVVKLLSGRQADRDQALELLKALDDPELWVSAVSAVRMHEIVGRRQVVRDDLDLLAALPGHLPEVVALRAETRSMWIGNEVPEAITCLTHLEEVTLAAAYGGEDPKRIERLELLAVARPRSIDGFGVDLEDGSVLGQVGVRELELRNATYTALPRLPGLERVELGVRSDVTTLGAGMPDLRRAEIRGDGLVEVDALAVAARLEDLELASEALADLSAIGRAVAAGAPLRRLVVRSARRVTDPSPLAAATRLEELRLQGLPLPDLAFLRGLRALRQVEVRQAEVTDLSPLAGLEALRSLDLRGCARVSDLRPLLGLPELRAVAVAGTAVTPDTAPRELLPYLTWAAEPHVDALSTRPRHPDDRRADAARP